MIDVPNIDRHGFTNIFDDANFQNVEFDETQRRLRVRGCSLNNILRAMFVLHQSEPVPEKSLPGCNRKVWDDLKDLASINILTLLTVEEYLSRVFHLLLEYMTVYKTSKTRKSGEKKEQSLMATYEGALAYTSTLLTVYSVYLTDQQIYDFDDHLGNYCYALVMAVNALKGRIIRQIEAMEPTSDDEVRMIDGLDSAIEHLGLLAMTAKNAAITRSRMARGLAKHSLYESYTGTTGEPVISTPRITPRRMNKKGSAIDLLLAHTGSAIDLKSTQDMIHRKQSNLSYYSGNSNSIASPINSILSDRTGYLSSRSDAFSASDIRNGSSRVYPNANDRPKARMKVQLLTGPSLPLLFGHLHDHDDDAYPGSIQPPRKASVPPLPVLELFGADGMMDELQSIPMTQADREAMASTAGDPQDRTMNALKVRISADVNLFDNPVDYDIWYFDPTEIARQWTLTDHAIFRAIPPCAYLTYRDKSRKEVNPHIYKVIDRFNTVSHWATASILDCDTASMRADMIGRLIVLATQLEKLRNYSGLAAVLSGMQQGCVARLVRTKILLPENLIASLNDLLDLMSPEKSYKFYFDALEEHIRAMRQAQRVSKTQTQMKGSANGFIPFEFGNGVVPYMAAHLSTLTSIVETNVPKLPNNPMALNLHRYRLITQQVGILTELHSTTYLFTPVRMVTTVIARALYPHQHLSKEEAHAHSRDLYKRSLQIESDEPMTRGDVSPKGLRGLRSPRQLAKGFSKYGSSYMRKWSKDEFDDNSVAPMTPPTQSFRGKDSSGQSSPAERSPRLSPRLSPRILQRMGDISPMKAISKSMKAAKTLGDKAKSFVTASGVVGKGRDSEDTHTNSTPAPPSTKSGVSDDQRSEATDVTQDLDQYVETFRPSSDVRRLSIDATTALNGKYSPMESPRSPAGVYGSPQSTGNVMAKGGGTSISADGMTPTPTKTRSGTGELNEEFVGFAAFNGDVSETQSAKAEAESKRCGPGATGSGSGSGSGVGIGKEKRKSLMVRGWHKVRKSLNKKQ